MLTIKAGAAFKKDYKRVKKRHYNLDALAEAIDLIALGSLDSDFGQRDCV